MPSSHKGIPNCKLFQRLDGADMGEAILVAQFEHVQFTSGELARDCFRFRDRQFEIGKRLSLTFSPEVMNDRELVAFT